MLLSNGFYLLYAGSRRLIEPPKGNCLLKLGLHHSGKSFQQDDCTICTCNNGTLHCQRKTCPPMDCSEDQQVRVSGVCCPYCPRKPLPAKGELYTSCRVGGRTYQVCYLLPYFTVCYISFHNNSAHAQLFIYGYDSNLFTEKFK